MARFFLNSAKRFKGSRREVKSETALSSMSLKIEDALSAYYPTTTKILFAVNLDKPAAICKDNQQIRTAAIAKDFCLSGKKKQKYFSTLDEARK